MQSNQEGFCLGKGADEGNILRNADGSVKRRKSLKELQIESPLGFQKFESEVPWQTIDEDIAMQLWEDVFKPLYTFCVYEKCTAKGRLTM